MRQEKEGLNKFKTGNEELGKTNTRKKDKIAGTSTEGAVAPTQL
jgi:hypothetical protein